MPSHTKAEREKNKESPGTLESIRRIIGLFTGGAPGMTANEKIKKAGKKAANKEVRGRFGG